MRSNNRLYSILLFILSLSVVTGACGSAQDDQEALIPKPHALLTSAHSSHSKQFEKDVKEITRAFKKFDELSEDDKLELLHRFRPTVQKWDITVGLSDVFSHNIYASERTRKKFANIVKKYNDYGIGLRGPQSKCTLQ